MKIISSHKEVRRYAIGDVHGCIEHLKRALHWCAEDARRDGVTAEVLLLGDFVDKGPNTKAVIELLITGSEYPHLTLVPLKGNHDYMLHALWYNPSHEMASSWWENGGQQTLMSYGWEPSTDAVPGHLRDLIPQEHADFLGDLPVLYMTEDLIFVHAGLNHERSIEEQTERDLMWIRGPFLQACHDFGRPVVHGHAPDKENPFVSHYRISLDAGCYGTECLAIACFDPGERIPKTAVVERNSITVKEAVYYMQSVDILKK